MTRDQAIATAADLRRAGFTWREIGLIVGRDKTWLCRQCKFMLRGEGFGRRV